MTQRPGFLPAMDDRNRRDVLLGAGVVGAGAVLSACGGSSNTTSETSAAAADGPLTVDASAVPVGGGLVEQDAKVIVTQPEAGQFHAFSAVCTHKGCLVEGVSDGKILCPCHGSQFSPTDGSVMGGPAPQPLAPKTVTESAGQLTIS